VRPSITSASAARIGYAMSLGLSAAVATWAQLTQDAIAYSAQLSAEARKLGLDAATKLRA